MFRLARLGSGRGTGRAIIAGMAALMVWLMVAETADAQDNGCVVITRSTPTGFYTPGDPLDVTVTFESTCGDDVSALAYAEIIPPTWTFVGLQPGAAPGDAAAYAAPDLLYNGTLSPGLIDFIWYDIPAFPFSVTYRVNTPDTDSGTKTITGASIFRVGLGDQAESSVPDANLGTSPPPDITLNGPSSITVECGDTYVDAGATAEDQVEGDITADIETTGTVDTSTPSTYTITYNVTNSNGDSATPVTRTVIVQDTMGPEINLIGGSVTINCGGTYSEQGATVVDACEGIIDTLMITGGDAVDPDTPGTYDVLYDAMDSTGNSATRVVRTVTVVDNAAPRLTLIGSGTITVQCGQDFEDPGAALVDDCEGDLGNVTGTGTLDTDSPGTYTLTYRGQDSSGNNAAIVRRTVRVVDTTAPVVTVGATEVTVPCGGVYEEIEAVAFDSCDGLLDVSIDTGNLDTNVSGSYTVTYSATDSSGNKGTSSRTIIVEDNEPPTITLNGDPVDDSVVFLECGNSYNELGATAVDACAGELPVEIDDSRLQSTRTGSYRIIYTAEDNAGLMDMASRLVVVRDSTPPVLTVNGGVDVLLACGATYTEAGATATDNCEDALNPVVVGGDTVDTTTPGTYVVTYNVTDGSGNAATQVTRTVTVADETPPTISLLGGAVTLDCGETFVEPGFTAFDGCDQSFSTDSVVVGGDAVDTSVPGTYTITYNGTDAAGNAAVERTRTVTVGGESCGEGEGEGEGEGDGAGEGEGEGEGGIEVCGVNAVTILSPETNLIVPTGTNVVTVDLSALVDVESEECLTGSVRVSYTVDGLLIGSSSDEEKGFPLSVDLGLGQYVVAATATVEETGASVADEINFSIRAGSDNNANGYLDNPFADMTGDLDLWQANVASVNCTRTVEMLSWFGGVAGDPVTVSVTNPANASQTVTVEVDRGLLNAGEQGILVVSIACDLTSLFAPQDASGLIADLPVNPLNGQAFIEVSVLVSSDGGATFDEIEDLMLNGESAMRVTYTAPGINGSAKFRSHPTFVDSGAGGIQVLPTAGAWTDTGVEAQDATGDTLTADLAALSVFGIFPDQTLPSELTVVSPDVSQPLDFGVLEPGDTSMIDLEITNSGDGVIMGMPQITAGGNVFSLVGASGYTIGAGVTRTITVRFLPNAEGMFDGTLELTGGDNGTVVIDLIGTGDRKVNSNFGCGGGAEAGGGFGDVLVLSLVLGALALATRRARRQQ